MLHTPEDDLKFFARIVSEQQVDVAQIDGEIAGFCSVHKDWIEQLYVAPEHQGCGLGTAFITRAQSDAYTLDLWVFERNRAAQGFYAKHGFVVAERTDGRNNEEQCPDLRMTWQRNASDA